jgi:hypothetical protein
MLFSVIFLTGILMISCDPNQNHEKENELKLTGLTGSYLGQTPPGDVPELFAPGVVADIFREHGSAAFTPDGKEVFWTRQVHTMTESGERSRLVVAMHMKQENGVWTQPKPAPFNLDRWNFITYISPDGKRLYFDSTRPINDEGESQRRSWIVDKKDDAWGEPRLFTELDKWDMTFSKVQVTANGNIYFQSTYPKPALPYESWGVGFFRSKLVDGDYQKPEMLDSSINTATNLDYAFHIDPNEEFIIFASDRPGGYSSLDLYISYRQANDSWGEAINLGEKINTHGIDGSDWPFLSPDSKYLFFMTTVKPKNDIDINQYTYDELRESQLSITNGDSKIHWVNTSFIEELKPEHLK